MLPGKRREEERVKKELGSRAGESKPSHRAANSDIRREVGGSHRRSERRKKNIL